MQKHKDNEENEKKQTDFLVRKLNDNLNLKNSCIEDLKIPSLTKDL